MNWEIKPTEVSFAKSAASDPCTIVICCSNTCFLNLPTCDSYCPRDGAYHCGKGNMC